MGQGGGSSELPEPPLDLALPTESLKGSLILLQRRLTHLCRMYFAIRINWKSPFPILGLLGGIFIFIQILIELSVSKQRSAASGLDLH